MGLQAHHSPGEDDPPHEPRAARSFAAARLIVLLISGVISFAAIDHGDPGFRDRCADSLHPMVTLGAPSEPIIDFTNRTLAYPPLVLRLIGAAQRAWLALEPERDPGALTAEMEERARAIATRRVDPALRDDLAATVGDLIVVGRCVVAAFAVLAVFALMRLVTLLFGAPAGIAAGSIAAVNPTLAIYSHTGNVDVPYVALALLALSFAASAALSGRRRDLLFAAAAAGLSIGAKDQAYALFVLTAPFAVAAFVFPGARSGPVRRPVPWGTILAGIAIAAAIYLLLPGVPIRWDWFRDHFEFLLGSGSEPFRAHEMTWAGLREVVIETSSLIVAGSSFTVALLGVVALFVLSVVRTRPALFLLVPIVSYLTTFLFPIGYTYLRFVLPLQLLLAGAAAVAIAAGAAVTRTRPPILALLARTGSWGVLALMLLEGARDTTRVLRAIAAPDPRSLAERHFRETIEPARRVDVWLTRTSCDPLLPPWSTVRVFDSARPRPGPPADTLVVCTPFFDNPATKWSSEKLDEFEWNGARFRETARFEPPFHDPLVQGVLWFPRVIFFERIAAIGDDLPAAR